MHILPFFSIYYPNCIILVICISSSLFIISLNFTHFRTLITNLISPHSPFLICSFSFSLSHPPLLISSLTSSPPYVPSPHRAGSPSTASTRPPPPTPRYLGMDSGCVGWMGEWINDWMNEWMNDWMIDWMIVWIGVIDGVNGIRMNNWYTLMDERRTENEWKEECESKWMGVRLMNDGDTYDVTVTYKWISKSVRVVLCIKRCWQNIQMYIVQ